MPGPVIGNPHPTGACPPAALYLDEKSISDPSQSHAVALLLAGDAFLASSRDENKPLILRSRLEKAGLALIEEALEHRKC